MKSLSEKLSEALVIINQHVKVADEAVSGWEKAEREVLSLTQQVEVLTVRNSTLEGRVVHLDGALKECMKQLRQTREEKDQIAHDTDELYRKLEMVDKENSGLKLELSSMAEELEIRLIERDLRNQAAEQASKQHLDCSKLNSALEKANNHQPKASKKPSINEHKDLKTMSVFGRSQMDSFVNIDLMDDFLEMEKLVVLHESSKLEEKLNKAESLEIVLKERENELNASRNQLEKAESKLDYLENELKISRNQFEESESKLVEQLKGSRDRIKKCESELKASRCRLEQVESKLTESKNELEASKNRLQKSESKLAETESGLETAEAGLEAAYTKRLDAETQCKALEAELDILSTKVESLENDVQMERGLSRQAEAKYQELKDEVSRLENETKCTKSVEELQFLRVKQETELAMAGSKFAECQKTIASLSRQLETLATLDDFLLDIND